MRADRLPQMKRRKRDGREFGSNCSSDLSTRLIQFAAFVKRGYNKHAHVKLQRFFQGGQVAMPTHRIVCSFAVIATEVVIVDVDVVKLVT